MSKLLSKITIATVAIAVMTVGTFYFTSTSRGNNNARNSNSAVTNSNHQPANLANVWDKKTEPIYFGTMEMTVYRSPSCGCCGMWIEHAKNHGFQIKDIKTDEMSALKQKYHIPEQLTSCHTTIIDERSRADDRHTLKGTPSDKGTREFDGYVMEGHIPADDIKRFLAQKSDMTGLAVPGMPIGTPGMEARDIKQPFQVLAFNDKGKVEVFKEYQSY